LQADAADSGWEVPDEIAQRLLDPDPPRREVSMNELRGIWELHRWQERQKRGE
jgi:hypothetical protein